MDIQSWQAGLEAQGLTVTETNDINGYYDDRAREFSIEDDSGGLVGYYYIVSSQVDVGKVIIFGSQSQLPDEEAVTEAARRQ